MVHKVVAHEDDGGRAISETMAIKRLRDDLRESPEDLKEIRDRFEREARLLDETLDHENIVPVLIRNLSGDHPYFVMPWQTAISPISCPRRPAMRSGYAASSGKSWKEWRTPTERA